MGIRLCIYATNVPEEIGYMYQSPKLFGYVEEDSLNSSKYLSSILHDEYDYEVLSMGVYYGPFTLTAEQYRTFIFLYLDDLSIFRPFNDNDDMMLRFKGYALSLLNTPEDKILVWG